VFWKRKSPAVDESQSASWPFDQAPNVAALTVRSVLEGDPVLFVAHDKDDHGWQFLDGREPMIEEGRAVCMADALDRDETLRTIADLLPGWIASRERVGGVWNRQRNPRNADGEGA
jgi:hypothetical protein